MALRVPIHWLKDYVDCTADPAALAERLTVAGMEVESVTALGADWDREKIRVGHIVKVAPHPNADRLCLATVDYGGAEPLTVVTGAPNVVRFAKEPFPKEPLKAPFAMNGAELIDGHAEDGRTLKLKPSNIRGVRSEGMVCSEKELGLSEEHEGILLLPADAPTGAPLVEYLGDQVLEFDIKGGFAHLLSVFGIARETAVLYDLPLKRDVLTIGRDAGKLTPTPGFVKLEIADPDLCTRYVAILIENVTIGPSPFWMQQRLKRAGQRPINAVVDATNYVMLELGQPLHAFDYGKLRPEGGKQGTPLIRVRRAKAGETMKTLDGVERRFDHEMLLITDGGGPVGIAGIMGGENSEVSDGTTAVLLEAANFEFLNSRRTSQLFKLRTEAGDRFGKNLDAEMCLPAALRCAHLIAEMCGGRVNAEYGDLYRAPVTREPIALDPAFVSRLLGIDVPEQETVRILEKLEFRVEKDGGASGKGGALRVTPPTHRKDITMAADLVEEVGRIHGYDRMAPTLIRDELPPQRRNRALEGSERVRDLLTRAGLDEIITYSIVALADEAKLDPDGGDPHAEDSVALRNPLDADRANLRRRLLPGALNTARANLRFQSRVATFEVGAVFLPQPGEILPAQPHRVCALLTGPREPDSWLAGRERADFDFFDAKGIAEAILRGLEIEDVRWERGADAAYHPGRSARLTMGGQPLGQLGELHPKVVAAFGLPERAVCALELELERLLDAWNESRQMAPISSHPPVYEDLAFIVAEDLPAERVQALIAETGRPLLRDVSLFDLYTGGQTGAGKKSLAYALTYQAEDRTLTDAEVAKVREKITRRVTKELDAVLRSG